MGILTDRVGEGLTALSNKFKEGLGNFIIFASSKGIEAFMDIMAKSAAKKLGPIIAELESKTEIPDSLKPMLEELKTPTGEFAAVLASQAGGAVIGSSIGKFIDYLTRPITLGLSYVPDYVLFDIDHAIVLYLRHQMGKDELYATAHKHGLSDEFLERLLLLKEGRLYSDIAIPLAKRDPAKWGWLLDDIIQNGMDPLRYAAILEYFYRVPGVQDVIRYAVKEAYTPEVYKAFGQDQEFPTEALHDADVAGVKPDHLMKEWIAHWELPGVTQGYDLLHRGLITKEQLQLLLKARDIMPFWREKLIGLSYDLPNRIELRMMARYGLIDKSKLIEILLKGGVDPQYVDLIADMNIAVGLITDLRTRYANGYITADDIKKELQTAGLSPDIQNRLYQYIVKVEKPAKLKPGKDLAVADIIKGVNRGLMEVAEAIDLLMKLGYDEDESYFKLAIGLTEEKEAPMPEYVKVNIDTIRRERRKLIVSHDQEVTDLLGQGLTVELATAYAINDDIRLAEKAEET